MGSKYKANITNGEQQKQIIKRDIKTNGSTLVWNKDTQC